MPDRAPALLRMLRSAPRDRTVVADNKFFALTTNRGKVRKKNEDAALVCAGIRADARRFTAAILADGMGGMDSGGEAADLATATIAAVLSAEQTNGTYSLRERVREAISAANKAVFEAFSGRAGAVVVVAILDGDHLTLAWAGDARAYAVFPNERPRQLTRDDTIAEAVARIDASAVDAMDTPLIAVGVKRSLEPHVETLPIPAGTLLLVSDGAHKISEQAFNWVCQFGAAPQDLVQRLVLASAWEGGWDNATAIALDPRVKAELDDADTFCAWVASQPRIWQSDRGHASPFERHASEGHVEPKRSLAVENGAHAVQHDERPKRPEQEPLAFEIIEEKKESG